MKPDAQRAKLKSYDRYNAKEKPHPTHKQLVEPTKSRFTLVLKCTLRSNNPSYEICKIRMTQIVCYSPHLHSYYEAELQDSSCKSHKESLLEVISLQHIVLQQKASMMVACYQIHTYTLSNKDHSDNDVGKRKWASLMLLPFIESFDGGTARRSSNTNKLPFHRSPPSLSK